MLIAAAALFAISADAALAPQREIRIPDKGKIVLPPPSSQKKNEQKPAEAAMPQTSDGLQRRFHERVLELRRSRHLSSSSEEELLRGIGGEFLDAADRAVELARRADKDLMHGVLRVLATYGGEKHAAELRFLLQTRPLGKATRAAVETMTSIGRDKAKELLFDCFTGGREAVRRYSAIELEPFVDEGDADRLLTLAGQGRPDVRLRAARLLGRIPKPEVITALVDMLRERSAIAEAACRALVRQGTAAVPALQDILRRPAAGRGYGFAAFALAAIESAEHARGGTEERFDAEMLPHLLAELETPDPFMQSAAAIALSGVAWRSTDTTGEKFGDHKVVGCLVRVVAPLEFVPHLAMLQELARERLVRFTGRDFRREAVRWRDWWSAVGAGSGYVAARRRLTLTPETAKLAALTWRYSEAAAEKIGVRTLRLRGVDALRLPPSTEVVLDLVVAPETMISMVGELTRVGFMQADVPTVADGGDAASSTLRLNVGAARCQTPPDLAPSQLAQMDAVVQRAVRENAWQLYRDPKAEPDPEAFWRAERRWLDAHAEDAGAIKKRFVDRVVGRIGGLSGVHLDLAIDHLAGVEGLREVFDPADARSLLDAIVARGLWDERSSRMADLVLAAGDEAPWRELLRASQQLAGEDASTVLPRMFALVGVDRVLESISDENEAVRIAAIDEVVSMREPRAIPQLIELLHDDSLRLKSTAAYALGRLRAVEARGPLIDLLARGVRSEGGISPHLRRIVWVALARLGGDEVFTILSGAFYSPEPEDRAAVLRAYAELRRPEAAREIAAVFGLRGPDDDLGLLALQLLTGMGDALASPALIPHLQSTNAAVRHEAALVLAGFGEPAVVAHLVELVERSEDPFRTLAGVAAVTGVDLTVRNDRELFLREWLARNGARTQGQWLIEALDSYGIEHSLDAVRLVAGVGTSQVEELCRLLIEVDPPLLRPLVGRMLRVTTGEDFGVVSPTANPTQLRAVADRYRILVDSRKAASGR